jgi:hypothetical protein
LIAAWTGWGVDGTAPAGKRNQCKTASENVGSRLLESHDARSGDLEQAFAVLEFFDFEPHEPLAPW